MAIVEILIGMIASGKSTYTSRRADEGAIIVNDDSIVTAVHGGNYLLYNPILKPLYKGIENNIIVQALSIGKDVVIDRPNFRTSTRQRYASLAHMLDLEAVFVVFEKHAPEVHAERRFAGDARGHSLEYWTGVARIHNDLWQEIAPTDGYDQLIEIKWNSR